MESNKLEENIIIVINSMRKIMELFFGPFLTVYFIKISQDSIIYLSLYYIFSYILTATFSFVIAKIIKNKFKLAMFRVGIILNFFYIMFIIIMKEEITNHLFLIAVLYSISSSSYWFPYNLFVINKIDNDDRTGYTVKSKIVLSIISVLCPILLGTIITVTNYKLTAIIILFISFIQIVLSFMLNLGDEKDLIEFNLKDIWIKLKDNEQIRRALIVEFFAGMNISYGALEILVTVLIFNSFKTDINLGIITSITTILSIIAVKIYGKLYMNRDDKNLIILSSILPVVSVFVLMLWSNNIIVVIYNICYVTFTSLLALIREIRLFNLANSYIVDKNSQSEFLSIREGVLNCGRVVSYLMLLFAGLSGSEFVLNCVMILLTVSILLMGLNIRKIKKIEDKS